MTLKKLREKLKWLDPFTYVDLYVMPKVNPEKSETLSTIVYVVFAFLFAFLLYNFLGLVLGTPAPIVIILSGSMEPLMYRGDIILLQGVQLQDIKAEEVLLNEYLAQLSLSEYASPSCTDKKTGIIGNCSSFAAFSADSFETVAITFSDGQTVPVTKEGDIVVYNSIPANYPVIHRVVAKINALDGTYLLTKGDSVFNPVIDQQAGITAGAVSQKQVLGKALFKIPLLGYLKLLVFDDIPCFFLSANPNGCPFP